MTTSEPEPSPAPTDKLDRSVIVTGLVVIAGMIMVVLDITIVNVAIDTLGQELDSPLSTTQWVVTGYLLALGVAVPVTGWANDRFGSKPVWISALVLFTGGSVLCALAWSIESLIAFRLLQGLGGGLMMPTAQTIIARAAGPARLGRAMAILGVPMLLGPIFGPVVGGALVENVSWHWIFIINLPVGIVAVLLAVWKLSNGKEPEPAGRLDVLGLVILAGGLVSLLYGLSEAASRGGFDEWGALGWIIVGAISIGVFIAYSLARGSAAVIDVRLFANRLFSSGAATVFLVGVALFGSMLLLPLYYQTVRGEGPLTAGLLLAPQGLGAMVAMPIAGRLTDRIGAGSVVPVGVGLALLGTFPFTQVGADTSYAWLSVALFVRGMGLGATMMPAMASAYSKLTHAAVSRAAPTLTATQQLGGSLGTALLVTVLAQRMANEFASQGLGGAEATPDQISSIPPELHDAVAPLLSNAFGQAFWIAFAMTAVVLIPALFLPRHRAATTSSVGTTQPR